MNRLAPAVILCAALLGGCTSQMAGYYDQNFSAIYERIEVSAAGRQGPVPLVLRGSPFTELSRERLAAAVIAGMSSSAALYPMRLTSGDPGPRSVDYRIIVVFGQPSLGANGLCAAPDAPFAVDAALNAAAAFCIGDRLLTGVRGRSHAVVTGPDDPAFAGFLHGLTSSLLPPDNPLHRGCKRLPIC